MLGFPPERCSRGEKRRKPRRKGDSPSCPAAPPLANAARREGKPAPLQPLGRERLVSGTVGGPREQPAGPHSLRALHEAPVSVLCPPVARPETGNQSALPCSPPTNEGRGSPGVSSPARPLGKRPFHTAQQPLSCTRDPPAKVPRVLFAASPWPKLQPGFPAAAAAAAAGHKELLAEEGRLRAAPGSLRFLFLPSRERRVALHANKARDKPSSRPRSRKTSCRLLKSEPRPTPPPPRTRLTCTPRGKDPRLDPASSSIGSGRAEGPGLHKASFEVLTYRANLPPHLSISPLLQSTELFRATASPATQAPGGDPQGLCPSRENEKS